MAGSHGRSHPHSSPGPALCRRAPAFRDGEGVSLLLRFCWEFTKQHLLISQGVYSPVKLPLNKGSGFNHRVTFIYRVMCPPGSSVHGILQVEYWSGLLCPPPGDLPNPGIIPESLTSLLHWQAGSLPPAPPGEPHKVMGLPIPAMHQWGHVPLDPQKHRGVVSSGDSLVCSCLLKYFWKIRSLVSSANIIMS